MANFKPFKVYILSVIDEFIQKYNISAPFLDIGCGKGDVALHLAKKGWQGEAIDIADQSVKETRKLLIHYPQVMISQRTISDTQLKEYNLILMLDVLEHIPDDKKTLNAAAAMELPGAHLMLTVPSNPNREWRWDDEIYGHLRRYNPSNIKQLLDSCNYQVIEMLDISFPFFWFLRRVYTAIKRPPKIYGSPIDRSKESPFTDAWNMGWISYFLSNPTLWKPAFRIQNRFRNHLDNGHELAILARRV